MDSFELAVNPHRRTIIHIDMDYFYAQVEEIHNPNLQKCPVGVQQKNFVVTANYIAREYGIQKLMCVSEALKLCPQLVLVNGEDLTKYRQMSAKIFEILHKFSPFVEKLGLDENFLDVTDIVNKKLVDNIDERISDVEGCIWPSDNDLTECQCGCASRLAIGTQIAKKIRNQLFEELGIRCSAGISHNKLLSKLVGSVNKPNNQTVLVASAGVKFMQELSELRKITGVGEKTTALLVECNIKTITDLQNVNFDIIKKKFGYESACRLKELSFGRDTAAVRPSGKPKSIGLEDSCRPISVRKNIEERFRMLLMRLVSQVSEDGRIPITIKIVLRKYDAKKKTSHRESKQTNILPSLFKQMHDGQIILADGAQEKLLKIVMRLFDRVVDMSKPYNITLLGLAFSKFQENKNGTSSIANFLIKKTDLEVQSVTSLKSEDCATNETADDYYRRRTTASPISLHMDVESVSSDVSDFSEPEIEPSPKKTRLGLLISRRRCLSIRDASDVASPSKLRVSELRLNSRDSDHEIVTPSRALPSPTICEKIFSQKVVLSCNSEYKNQIKNIEGSEIAETSLHNFYDHDNSQKCTADGLQTTITGNLANIPCPSTVDPDVFKELPTDVQKELISSWRNSITSISNNSSNHKGQSNSPSGTASGASGASASANTLHRYFIKNK